MLNRGVALRSQVLEELREAMEGAVAQAGPEGVAGAASYAEKTAIGQMVGYSFRA